MNYEAKGFRFNTWNLPLLLVHLEQRVRTRRRERRDARGNWKKKVAGKGLCSSTTLCAMGSISSKLRKVQKKKKRSRFSQIGEACYRDAGEVETKLPSLVKRAMSSKKLSQNMKFIWCMMHEKPENKNILYLGSALQCVLHSRQSIHV